MTTSGSYDFTSTRDQIINRALRIIGVVPQGETATAEQVKETAESLNSMVKSWQNEHIYLWSTELVTKTLTASSQVLGTDGKNYTCLRSHTSAASNRPITGADYSTYWVESGSSGVAWATSTAYSSIGDFDAANDTLDILSAFIRDGGNDWPLSIIPMHEFMNIWQKDRTGRPFVLALHKTIPAKTVYLYYQPDLTTYVLHYLRVRKLEDFDVGANTPDFPENWIEPLVWGLAANIAPEYNVKSDRQRFLDAKAEEMRRRAKVHDSETHSGEFIAPAYRM